MVAWIWIRLGPSNSKSSSVTSNLAPECYTTIHISFAYISWFSGPFPADWGYHFASGGRWRSRLETSCRTFLLESPAFSKHSTTKFTTYGADSKSHCKWDSMHSVWPDCYHLRRLFSIGKDEWKKFQVTYVKSLLWAHSVHESGPLVLKGLLGNATCILLRLVLDHSAGSVWRVGLSTLYSSIVCIIVHLHLKHAWSYLLLALLRIKLSGVFNVSWWFLLRTCDFFGTDDLVHPAVV